MKVIIAKRVDAGTADTEEIAALAEAAGHEIVGELTQTRTEDAALHLGEGKVAELARLVAETGAEGVVFDNQLGPYQTYNLGRRLPDGVVVTDRFRLILDIFGQRASTRKAQLQVELAELRYELPRAETKASLAQREERPGFMGLGEYDESREQDIEAQISQITEELAGIEETEEHRRQQRRESGFDLVALAGYTNAGKSTLLRRLAADLDVDENEGRHPDLERTAESENRLFTTLGTTTRRAATERPVLVTDTVGFVSNLPHWLVESFKSTLDSVYLADLVLLIVDASEPVEAMREKLVTSHDTLYERNEAPIVTVLNKADRVDDAELDEKRAALSALAPDPVAVSAAEGTGLEELFDRIEAALPDYERERLVLPMAEGTMGLVSWIHDHARVEDVSYGESGEQVTVAFAARPSVVERSRARASELPVPAGS
ncbi:GTPase HflX [Halobacteriales archaeon QS_4_69_34]|nr:MAG: GTPase HflX [Halobacteriales archaeon QS_4_69_34]